MIPRSHSLLETCSSVIAWVKSGLWKLNLWRPGSLRKQSAGDPCATCYVTADHLGSTRVVWGADGQIKKLYDYAPFGEEVGANYRAGDARYPGLAVAKLETLREVKGQSDPSLGEKCQKIYAGEC